MLGHWSFRSGNEPWPFHGRANGAVHPLGGLGSHVSRPPYFHAAHTDYLNEVASQSPGLVRPPNLPGVIDPQNQSFCRPRRREPREHPFRSLDQTDHRHSSRRAHYSACPCQPARRGTPFVVLPQRVQFLTRKKGRNRVQAMQGNNLQPCRHPDAQPTGLDGWAVAHHLPNEGFQFRLVIHLTLLTLGIVLMSLGIDWLLFLGPALIILTSFFSARPPIGRRSAGLLVCAVSAVACFFLNLRNGNAFTPKTQSIWWRIPLVGLWLWGVSHEFHRWRKTRSLT
jgi:hypothetical protein